MRIWIKASIFTFGIAIAILFFQSYWFLDGKNLEDIEQNKLILNKLSPEQESIKLLKDRLFVSTNPKNYSNFALRLSSSYERLAKYDSAAKYKELFATRFPNEENIISAGLMYFKAFENASGKEEEQRLISKSIALLSKVQITSSSANIKMALAKLYISNEEPNKATVLLREVLRNNAANLEALYMLGIQLYQFGEFEQAGDYLTKLVHRDSSNINAIYHLGVCKIKTENPIEAQVLFEKLKLLDISEELQNNIDEYLNEIK